MPNLKDNLKQWRDSARIDWFGQFIKAWIPFNAWMTDTYGDLSDRELLDRVKAGGNVVYNRILPILAPSLPQSRDSVRGWQDNSPEAQEFRLKISELHRLLQGCIVEGRRGRVSFELVDTGPNGHTKEHEPSYWKRAFTVERNLPNKGNVTLTMTNTKGVVEFTHVQSAHDRDALEDEPAFQKLEVSYRTKFIAMHGAVKPRLVRSILAEHGVRNSLKFGDTDFKDDPPEIFAALVEVIYNLRNALFHGSITPNEQHNEIYEPAYYIVMRFVRCTI